MAAGVLLAAVLLGVAWRCKRQRRRGGAAGERGSNCRARIPRAGMPCAALVVTALTTAAGEIQSQE
eukprot:3911417-Pyramimonas_sp.AAC.1